MKPSSPLPPHQKGVVGSSQPRQDIATSLERQRLQACGLVMSVRIATGGMGSGASERERETACVGNTQ